MKEKINKVETYESPKCEVMELLSEGPLLRPSLGIWEMVTMDTSQKKETVFLW